MRWLVAALSLWAALRGAGARCRWRAALSPAPGGPRAAFARQHPEAAVAALFEALTDTAVDTSSTSAPYYGFPYYLEIRLGCRSQGADAERATRSAHLLGLLPLVTVTFEPPVHPVRQKPERLQIQLRAAPFRSGRAEPPRGRANLPPGLDAAGPPDGEELSRLRWYTPLPMVNGSAAMDVRVRSSFPGLGIAERRPVTAGTGTGTGTRPPPPPPPVPPLRRPRQVLLQRQRLPAGDGAGAAVHHRAPDPAAQEAAGGGEPLAAALGHSGQGARAHPGRLLQQQGRAHLRLRLRRLPARGGGHRQLLDRLPHVPLERVLLHHPGCHRHREHPLHPAEPARLLLHGQLLGAAHGHARLRALDPRAQPGVRGQAQPRALPAQRLRVRAGHRARAAGGRLLPGHRARRSRALLRGHPRPRQERVRVPRVPGALQDPMGHLHGRGEPHAAAAGARRGQRHRLPRGGLRARAPRLLRRLRRAPLPPQSHREGLRDAGGAGGVQRDAHGAARPLLQPLQHHLLRVGQRHPAELRQPQLHLPVRVPRRLRHQELHPVVPGRDRVRDGGRGALVLHGGQLGHRAPLPEPCVEHVRRRAAPGGRRGLRRQRVHAHHLLHPRGAAAARLHPRRCRPRGQAELPGGARALAALPAPAALLQQQRRAALRGLHQRVPLHGAQVQRAARAAALQPPGALPRRAARHHRPHRLPRQQVARRLPGPRLPPPLAALRLQPPLRRPGARPDVALVEEEEAGRRECLRERRLQHIPGILGCSGHGQRRRSRQDYYLYLASTGSSPGGIYVNMEHYAKIYDLPSRNELPEHIYLDKGDAYSFSLTLSIRSTSVKTWEKNLLNRIKVTVVLSHPSNLVFFLQRRDLVNRASVLYKVRIQDTARYPQQGFSGKNLLKSSMVLKVVNSAADCYQYSEAGPALQGYHMVPVFIGCPPGKRMAFDVANSVRRTTSRNKRYFSCVSGNPELPCFFFEDVFYPLFLIQDMVTGDSGSFTGRYTLKVIGGSAHSEGAIERYRPEDVWKYNVDNASTRLSLIWQSAGEDPPHTDRHGYPVHSSTSNGIRWLCQRDSPCHNVAPTGLTAPGYFFLVLVSNRDVDTSTYCDYNLEFILHVQGLQLSATSKLFFMKVTLSVLTGLAALYCLYCHVGRRMVASFISVLHKLEDVSTLAPGSASTSASSVGSRADYGDELPRSASGHSLLSELRRAARR